MKTIYKSLLASGTVAAMLVMAACSAKEPAFIGIWESVKPVDVTCYFHDATSALTTISIQFATNQEYTGGPVTVSNRYQVTCPLATDSLPTGKYKASFIVKASCRGSWTYDVDESDEILLQFNYDAFSVNIDPASIHVTPSDSIAMRQAQAKREVWTMDAQEAFRRELLHFSTIEDVDVSKDQKMLKIEVQDPKEEIRFIRK